MRICAIAIGVFLLSACGCGAGTAAPPTIDEDGPCSSTSRCASPPPAPFSIVVANETDADLDVVFANPTDVRVDHGVIDGALSVPLPHELFDAKRTTTIPAHADLTAGADIEVISSGGTITRANASLVGLIDGPLFLAVGKGRVLLKKRADGTQTIEAEDPRAVTLVPVERPLAECAAGSLDDGYAISNASATFGDEASQVTSVTRDADGCRVLMVEDGTEVDTATVRVCVPDAVYPFADSDVLHFRRDDVDASLGSTWLVESAGGTSMRLVDAFIGNDRKRAVASLTLFADADATCVRVEDCGSVDVPAKLTYAFAGATARAVTYGAALVVPADASRSYVVLRARARPVMKVSCISADLATTDTSRAHAWVAIMEKGKPTP